MKSMKGSSFIWAAQVTYFIAALFNYSILTVCVCVFQVNLKSGTNILYWRTGGVVMGTKVVKPVFLKNIQIEGQEQ